MYHLKSFRFFHFYNILNVNKYILYIYNIYIYTIQSGSTIELSGSMEGKSFNTCAGICPYRSINSLRNRCPFSSRIRSDTQRIPCRDSGTGRCGHRSCNSTSIDNIDNSRYRQDPDIIDNSMCR